MRAPRRRWAGWLLVAGLAAAALAATLAPLLRPAPEYGGPPPCSSNLTQLFHALSLYAQDHDERLPPPERWQDGVAPYVKREERFRCPQRPQVMPGYAFNAGLAQPWMPATTTGPVTAPVLFESALGKRNAHGTLESFVRPHQDRGNVLFLDGHVAALEAPPAPAAPSIR